MAFFSLSLLQIGEEMKWTTIDSALHEQLMNNMQYQEIHDRLQMIDKELIRLIDAKRRYEEELDKLISEMHFNDNTSK